MTIAAASPLGPEPTTIASGLGMPGWYDKSAGAAVSGADYWCSRLVFQRAVAAIYFIAFVCAVNQFVPLLGEHGLLPAPRFVSLVPFSESPSLFYFAPTDTA